MLVSPSSEKPSSPSDGKSRKLVVNVPVNDENLQNYKIQMAVNRYNNSYLPPCRQYPLSAYKSSFIRTKTPISNNTPDSSEPAANMTSAASCLPRNRLLEAEGTRICQGASYASSPRLGLQKHRFINSPTRPLKYIRRGSSQQMLSPALWYTGPDDLPTCHIYKSPSKPTKKQSILSQLNAHSAGLPVTRFLDDSAEKYSDLKSTRSVLDVLQDMSRKRMHGKDVGDDVVKRRCKGLGGDIVNENDGEVAYQPLFVPKGRTSLLPRRDQTTQTAESSNQANSTDSLSPQDPKFELRRKLAQKNNEIAASLSSSLRGFVINQRKRAAEALSVTNSVPNVAEAVMPKKQRYSDAKKSSPDTTLDTPTVRKEKRVPVIETSPKSPRSKDRLMAIYLDLQNESDTKLNAIKAINTSPGGTQFVRPAGTSETTDAAATKQVENTTGTLSGPTTKSTSTIDVIKSTQASPAFSLGNSPLSNLSGTSPVVIQSIGKSVSNNSSASSSPLPSFTFGTSTSTKSLGTPPSTSISTTPSFNFGSPNSSKLLATPKTTFGNVPTIADLRKENLSLQTKQGNSSTLSTNADVSKTASSSTLIVSSEPSVETTSAGNISKIGNFSGSPVALVTCTTTSISTPITTSETRSEGIGKTSPFQIQGPCNVSPTVPKHQPSPGGFSFQSSAPNTNTSTFSFGSNTATTPSKSTPFSFGNSQTTLPNSTISSVQPIPTFSIRSPVPSAIDEKTTANGNATTTTSAPFSFGAAKPTDAKPFSFGAKTSSPTDPRLESKFYNPKSDSAVTPPSFLFGASKSEPSTAQTVTTSAPTFLFGKTSVGNASFSFGDKVATTTPTSASPVHPSKSEIKWSFATDVSSSNEPSPGLAATTAESVSRKIEAKPLSVFARLGVPLANKAFEPEKPSGLMPASATGQNPFESINAECNSEEKKTTSIKSSLFTEFGGAKTTDSSVTSTTPAFNFGQKAEKSTTSDTTIASTTNLFPAYAPNLSTATTSVTTATSGNIFGQNSSLGTATTTANSGFGFGSNASLFIPNASTTATTDFAQTTTSAPTPLFGQSSSINAPVTTSPSTFGQTASIFGTGLASNSFGANPSTTSTFTFGQTSVSTAASTLVQPSAVFSFGPSGQSTAPTAPSQFGMPNAKELATSAQSLPFSSTPTFASSATSQPFSGVFGQSTGGFGQTTTGTTNSFGAGVSNMVTKPPITFGANPSTTSTFTFGQTAVTTVASTFGQGGAVFSFGSSGQNAASNPPNPFGASSAKDSVTTPQNMPFGTTPTLTTSTTPQQPFTGIFGQSTGGFGQNASTAFGQSTPATTVSSTPTFSFGNSKTSATTPFSFGKPTSTGEPLFGTNSAGAATAFGTSSAGAFGVPATGTPLGFGANATATTGFGAPSTGTTPAFGGNATASTTFGAPSTGPNPGFGGNVTASPTFGAPAAAPVFNFGSNPTTPASTQPAPFAFGSTSLPSTGFNFSASASTTGNNFSFGSSGSTPVASFGQSSTSGGFGQTGAGAFSSFGQSPAAGAFVPGTFSIGAGTSQSRSRGPVRARRR